LLSHIYGCILPPIGNHLADKKAVWKGTLALMAFKTLETLGLLQGYGIARLLSSKEQGS
jgi:hypothetical protein